MPATDISAREYSAPAGAGLFPPAGGVTFSGGEKVTKKPLETKVSRLPFCERFYEANGCRAPFDTLFVLSRTDFPRPVASATPAAHKEGL